MNRRIGYLRVLVVASMIAGISSAQAFGKDPNPGGTTPGGPGAANASQQNAGASGSPGSQGSAFFNSQMLAYGSANEVADVIAESVCDGAKKLPNSSGIIIYDPTSFQNLQAWHALEAAATVLNSEYKALADVIAKMADKKASVAAASAGVPGSSRQAKVAANLATADSLDATALSQSVAAVAAGAPSAATGGGSGPFLAGSDLSGLIGAIAASTTNNATTFAIPDATMAIAIMHSFGTRQTCVTADLKP